MARVRVAGPRGIEAVLIGAVAFNGLTGVGGGSIMVPLLTGRLGLSQHRARGSSLAIMMFAAFAGSLETGAVTSASEPGPEVLSSCTV